jgi:modulator of FtsH protease
MDFKEWHDFFVVTAGAAATLTGLIFVGVSINITKILSFAKLPDRALLSLVLLLNIMVVSTLMLVPAQSYMAIGIETLVISVCVYSFVTGMDRGIYKKTDPEYKKQYRISMLYNQLSLLPYIAAGIVILLTKENGVYWLVPGIIISFIKSVVDAWVLLVEINR